MINKDFKINPYCYCEINTNIDYFTADPEMEDDREVQIKQR